MAYKQLGDVLSALGYREQTKTAVCFFNIFLSAGEDWERFVKKENVFKHHIFYMNTCIV